VIRGKWRIRWIDAQGKRRSEVFSDRATAVTKLREREQEAEEISGQVSRSPVAANCIA
jgi:hypothetical protein